jgi:AraC-like DNA-binding protein
MLIGFGLPACGGFCEAPTTFPTRHSLIKYFYRMSLHPLIENWFAKFKPFELSYKNGFLEMPYLVGSPRAMIERFKKMPFLDFDEATQSIETKTPFLNITTYYRELQQGLFLVHSEAKFKANVSFRHQYSKGIPNEYYCLSLRIDRSGKKLSSLANDIGYADRTWLIFKPEAKIDHHHFKGTTGKYFSLYFTRSWLEDYLAGTNKNELKELKAFLRSKRDHLICPSLPESVLYNDHNLADLIVNGRFDDKKQSVRLNKEALNFLSFFTCKLQAENINERHFKLTNLERMKVVHAERILKQHLYKKFPGIGSMAAEVGLSATKLKECFKTLYEKTLFQYFQAMQMEQASRMIASNDMPIARVANKFSYENASKFSAAFKEHHGRLPSEIKHTA